MCANISQDEKEQLEVGQNEIKKLQREYRIVENDKNAYVAEIKCHLIKQRQVIKTLEKEKARLLARLEQSEDPKMKKDLEKTNKETQRLENEYKNYAMLIKREKEILTKLNLKLQDMNRLPRIPLSTNVTKMDDLTAKLSKNLETVQDKLYNATVKCNKIISENAVLRAEVNNLLQERARLNELYKKSAAKLNSLKKSNLELIEKATFSFDQRNQVETKLKQLRERNEEDKRMQQREMQELQRQLDYLKKLQMFFSVKNQKRIMADLEQKEAEKRRQILKEKMQNLKRSEEILEKIKELSNEQYVDKLGALFTKQEDENFALFNYVNEITNEVETLQNEIKLLTSRLDNRELSLQTKIAEPNLKKNLENLKQSFTVESQQLQNTKKISEQFFQGLEDVLKSLRWDSLPVFQLIDKRAKDAYINLYLDILSKKIEQ